MLRKLIGILAAGIVLVSVVPQPASAAVTTTIVFTAGATLNNELYWPAAAHPNCGGGGLCPAPAGTTYSFSTNNAGLGGQNFCAAVVDNNGVRDTSLETSAPQTPPTNDPPCKLSSTGSVNAGILIGPHCGWSSGIGTVAGDGTIAPDLPTGIDLDALGYTVEWPQSAGTILPLINKDSAGNIIGAGAVQSTGANNSVCGANPTNPNGTTAFAVTGFTATRV